MLDPDRTASLIYLVLLGCVLGGYFLVNQRKNLGKMTQYAALWGFIFLGAIVAAGLWQDIRSDIAPSQSVLTDGTVTVPRSPDGHFYLTLEVNGTPTRFVVDTGATDIVLTLADAQAAGIATDMLIFSGRANTANGPVEIAPTRIETLALGGIPDTNIRAVVNSGEMRESLLGMAYLSRFSRLVIAEDELLLER
jgi:aspartyl protease family protein